jgi:hypothetical protein
MKSSLMSLLVIIFVFNMISIKEINTQKLLRLIAIDSQKLAEMVGIYDYFNPTWRQHRARVNNVIPLSSGRHYRSRMARSIPNDDSKQQSTNFNFI